MEKSILIRNALLVNQGLIRERDVYIRRGRIERIDRAIVASADIEIDAQGRHLIPGVIDDQVHFREPGLTHKATIATESRAAVAGGVTSFMEMPNVQPPAVTQELLEAKYQIAARTSLANYSFFMGTTNDNLDEVLRTDPRRVCGIKIFMGSSTGNMLVDDPRTLERLFAEAPTLIATHCEDETTVRANTERYRQRYGDRLHASHHPRIRSVKACLLSSSLAVNLAKRLGTRLHVLHITTRDELKLFDNRLPLDKKRITAEVCVHHLYFHSEHYARWGNLIKCNPAIKNKIHRDALLPALLNDVIDVVATDHAPHTLEEKKQPYLQAPSGLPLVQHGLNVMLDLYHAGKISLEKIVEKMCHAPAIAFRLRERGFIEEGYWADLAIVDVKHRWTVRPENILYKCGWSPFEGHTFHGRVLSTIVSGHLAWHEGRFNEEKMGERLEFEGWS
ncbi:MAG: dihydroorotase [Saprospiraceae bacterium]|nr:dihydroorotase [Saprospiraceae bacterium]MDW8229764.1 dihydroorotase [Saprospiraceae bacterium]